MQFRTWARPEQIHNAEYALDIGVRIQEYFEGYFGIDYPFEKQGRHMLYGNKTFETRLGKSQ